MNEGNYIIYKAENQINGWIYIGATGNSVHQRKLDHINRANRDEKGKFYEAIGTYGEEAFNWEQIDTAVTTDELAHKEKTYIIEFNSKDNGYNSDSGGGLKKTVYQYKTSDGSLVNSYDCLESAGEKINATKQQLSRACLCVNKVFNGFYWSYEYLEPFKPKTDNRKKSIIQFDLNDQELAYFNSIAKASILTGSNKSSIAKVCRGERNQAGGFKWSYK